TAEPDARMCELLAGLLEARRLPRLVVRRARHRLDRPELPRTWTSSVLRPGPRRSPRLANTCAGTGPSVVPNTCQTCRDGRWQASSGTVRLTVYKTAALPVEHQRRGGRGLLHPPRTWRRLIAL